MQRVIKQLIPQAGVSTLIYKVDINVNFVTLGSLIVCNQENTKTTFSVRLCVQGEASNDKQFLFRNVELCEKQTLQFGLTSPITAKDEVWVESGNGLVSFNLFGISLQATNP